MLSWFLITNCVSALVVSKRAAQRTSASHVHVQPKEIRKRNLFNRFSPCPCSLYKYHHLSCPRHYKLRTVLSFCSATSRRNRFQSW
ncbi:uncharacterized protein BKA55DRAFT_583370 [Fusarium redolens]|uniref:Uncharacterized protein n=1 Tax=Fusarium redolens TaxID=48865 RepID=A0A9P9G0X0_FUSRE|nr:uncharacterized protein BKA55DRAFT_583370 [Fusarium redolens]KAH7230075.1 hypothetical protein BKA55DRAFT_583370 [Fusarium redolens]